MIRDKMENRIKLYGFNNLTKSLSFNMYDICYAKTVEDRNAYLSYIDEQYNAERLTGILKHLTQIIGANILNIAKQDYDPQGASVAILICEEPLAAKGQYRDEEPAAPGPAVPGPAAPGPAAPGSAAPSPAASETVLAHLDKSHITVHTYPEYHPDGGVCTFRADIDVSTCGEITPLKALNYLINSFEADIMTIDYRVRGFTRDITGKKLFMEHPMTSIQNYIPRDISDRYQMIDVNVYQENIFHTKCKLKEFDLDDYLFGYTKAGMQPGEVRRITRRLQKEMDEIFYGRNMVGFHD